MSTKNSVDALKRGSRREFRQNLAAIMANVDEDFVLTEDSKKFMMELADAFLEDVVGGATKIACHRGASNIRQEDIGFYLEHAWDMKVPGYTLENKVAVTNVDSSNVEARRPKAGTKRKAPAKK